jgi:hypothetical protein
MLYHMKLENTRQEMYAQADHSMGMIRALPPFAANDSTASLPPDVRVACLEAFFMHIRAITDFLCCRSAKPNRNDFSAQDFVDGWQAAPIEAADRLATYWKVASQQVAHFSRERLQEDPANPEFYDVTLAGLQAMANDAYAVWCVFRAADKATHDVSGIR